MKRSDAYGLFTPSIDAKTADWELMGVLCPRPGLMTMTGGDAGFIVGDVLNTVLPREFRYSPPQSGRSIYGDDTSRILCVRIGEASSQYPNFGYFRLTETQYAAFVAEQQASEAAVQARVAALHAAAKECVGYTGWGGRCVLCHGMQADHAPCPSAGPARDAFITAQEERREEWSKAERARYDEIAAARD